MTHLLRWLDRLPSWLRSGVVTGTVTAFVTSGAALLAWLEEFFDWAAGAPGVTFPDLGVLRALVVGVAAGGVFGAANAMFRGAQEWLRRRGHHVGNPPVYPSRAVTTRERGQVNATVALLIVIALLLLVLVLRGTGIC